MIKSSYKAIVAQKDDNGLYYALYESSDGLKEWENSFMESW